MNSVCDKIELTLPFKAEYVSVARLVASGVCNRIGFDIETIEDIKVAISEVCSKIVSMGSKITDNYTIIYGVSENTLNVEFVCDDPSIKCIFDEEKDGLAISIITALMDNVVLCDKSNRIISMSKVLEGNR
ncbi:MAG TPA: anti-sigma regulatory factor [Hungateiclostridium thermocellum]|uniref:Anti-sigma regulatory factor, serine/threonine protein kinase n=1 Tax=Acetivibrio thermocellus (strain ATCC 27405 / DSM 1237 / JCM 9322 / NBRC 103400 / NCIMB 10682 / NRRL B-4536 / VPI 7372) TaxID=203119 RepID=A3DJG8_ACET2|nr:ATP-binding protein [Acetivibrio thermocellus]CDG37390.1 putative anti-sigma regulatory factor,serine/threonine protein kinase [Acetivibrio thermocellus BC1]ABN54097.1 putative anti-sigma regulatory factor, serine/threonine protein kinase [Acetivibrio thermocellus ATCC 27405]ANV75190.1 putative anti-sigma regulatory factor, serine/threonine protein kinase [Acetivibrio thermocellus DSM 2360]NLU27786.1 anti-sigma regulatory factor [Acetivibrio thermocellus]THJ77908.1 anti-sigma regulatory fac